MADCGYFVLLGVMNLRPFEPDHLLVAVRPTEKRMVCHPEHAHDRATGDRRFAEMHASP